MIDNQTAATLEAIKEAINQEYGFHDDIPRINYGPCGVFAQVFFQKWNSLFSKQVHICFVLTKDKEECDHILIRLSSGDFYDGGIGVHERTRYEPQFVIEEMIDYDENLLEKWSYGLNRTYPRFCPNFDRTFIEKIIHTHLEQLHNLLKA